MWTVWSVYVIQTLSLVPKVFLSAQTDLENQDALIIRALLVDLKKCTGTC